ncbi:PREDICTED: acid sphingomyelinase-like phosphodiesterase 3a [Gekko japonicus]|uniref:Acid sphingomyelinase-like phosphodiesterase n=1 Tax=Gekko japonicus TaxID=146911 RepID=A0ABM1JMZ5_GEKJA|nr:PREDICTED: acid sphingomyelinase-like phosphodiesterase 3a [Gekko japonicus]
MGGVRGARGATLSPWGLLLLPLLLRNAMHGLVSSAPAPASPEVPFGAGQFWHITDLHLDPTYHITINRTQVCASSKGVNASSPGLFGDFMCDSPYKLILSALKFMKDSGQQASFMIWTGDSPPHVPAKELSTKVVIDIIGNMTSTIRSFFPELQVFPALGNHDYWPQDQLPASVSEVYSAAADFWKPWLTDEAVSTLRKGGFYTQIVQPSISGPLLRIISLNTVLYYGPNKVTLNMTDPANQLEWLEEVLEMALQNKEKVYVIAHVPVGYLPYARNTTAIREYYNERLIEIFRRYSSIIAGQFFGHTHRDSIMILLDKKGNPINSLFVAPAVTPVKSLWEVDSNNPGVRLYQYDPLSYSVLDLWQFYLNLTEANMKNASDWKLEYVMTKAYGIEDLKPESLHGMVKQLIAPHSKLFPKYYNNYFVSYDGNKFCEEHCRISQLCAIQYLDLPSYTDCIGNEDTLHYE